MRGKMPIGKSKKTHKESRMKVKVFAIYDDKAEAYLPPFYMHQEGQASRSFQDAINSPDHTFYLHPADYTLFHLGEFDDKTAQFDLNSSFPSLGNGIEFKISNEPEEQK